MSRIQMALLLVGAGLLAWGGYQGLVVAPTEVFMGDVYRIMFVHVPAAWVALLCFVACFVGSLGYLWKASQRLDAVAEASAEVGVFFSGLLLVTGSIWGRPTWGVWWSWDPRLTTMAILFFAYAGYLALRQFVDEPEKRASWAAVAAIIISADIPIVYYSVKWWNSLHQVQSTARTMAPEMRRALMFNAFAFLCLGLWQVLERYRLSRANQFLDLAPPPPTPTAASTGGPP